MYKRIITWAAIVLILFCFILGIRTRRTFTNHTADEAFLDQMITGLWNDEISPAHLDNLRRLAVEEAEHIFHVKGSGRVEHRTGYNVQRAEVIKVFKGESLPEGTVINFVIGTDYFLLERNAWNNGFVNWVKDGNDYLLFLDKKETAIQSKDDPMYTVVNTVISPIFPYAPNVSVVPSEYQEEIEGMHYARIGDIKELDFFAEDQVSLDHWLETQQVLTQQFPITW